MDHLQISSDCKQVVHHMHQRVGGDYGTIIGEILQTSMLFSLCNFSFKPRELNYEAHRLARFGVSLPVGRHLWLGSSHDPIVIPMNILANQ